MQMKKEPRYIIRERAGKWWAVDTVFTPPDWTDYAYYEKRRAYAKADELNAVEERRTSHGDV